MAPKSVIAAYARRLNKQKITLEDVPENIRDAVEAEAKIIEK